MFAMSSAIKFNVTDCCFGLRILPERGRGRMPSGVVVKGIDAACVRVERARTTIMVGCIKIVLARIHLFTGWRMGAGRP